MRNIGLIFSVLLLSTSICYSQSKFQKHMKWQGASKKLVELPGRKTTARILAAQAVTTGSLFKSFEMISNGAGPITGTVGFDVTEQPTDHGAYSADWYRDVLQGAGSVTGLPGGMQSAGGWYFITATFETTQQGALNRWTAGGNLVGQLVGKSLEIRFTASGGKALTTTREDQVLIDVPFELWNLGTTPNDPSDDIRMIPLVRDNEQTGWGDPSGIDAFTFVLDHEADADTNDPFSDWIHFHMPVDETPGEAGYNQFVAQAPGDLSAIGSPVLARVVLMNWDRHQGESTPGAGDGPINAMPEVGTTFRLTFADAGPASASVDEASADFGLLEQQVLSPARTLTLHNTGNGFIYGRLRSSIPEVELDSPIYLETGETMEINVRVRATAVGNFSGTLNFEDGNLGPLNMQVPFTINSIPIHTFDANDISMFVLRNGRFANNPVTGAGLEWPKGSGMTAVYSAGVWIGAQVFGQTRTATASYSTEFGPGPVINGQPADPQDPRYRVYKISAGDNAGNNPDFAAWPADQGAPVNPDGTPKLLGDQTIFAVYNDLNPDNHSFGTDPLGVEVQQTVFGFNDIGAKKNTVFMRFKIINRSNDMWQDTFVALWSDPDLGRYNDDFVGVDVARDLGYCYNSTNNDAIYGIAPPAVGFDFLKGAFFSKPIQAFAFYTNSAGFPEGDPRTGNEAYNFLRGLRADGSPFHDPVANEDTTFALNGDPVTASGWIDSNAGDRRFLLSTGPFTLEPGQAKEVIAAIIVSRGSDNLDGITELRRDSDVIRNLFDNGNIFGGAVENVSTTEVAPNATETINDVENSGAELDFTAGDQGATVEVATYVAPPPGAEDITTSAIEGVGNYVEVQVSGDIQWPVELKVYYTASDLAAAGIAELNLAGLYYWSSANQEWRLYSDSGADDQGRGPSTTSVNTTNVTVNNVQYEGFVQATAYHLTPVRIGTKVKLEYDDYVFLANKNVKIDGTVLSDGDIHSNGDITFDNGKKGNHTGNLSALNDITIEKGVTINGNAIAGDEIYEFGDITGTKQDHAAVTGIPLPTLSFTAGGPGKTAPKKGSLTLGPGIYGKVKVEKKAVLFLSAGNYFMDELDTDKAAKVVIDVSGGPVNINIAKDLDIDRQVEIVISPSGENDSELVIFSSMQKNKIDIGKYARVLGTLIVPNAEVHFSKGSQFKGTVCADKVTVEKEVTFFHHDSPNTLPKVVIAPEDLEEDAIKEAVPIEFSLAQNYPNPFNPTTMISYQLPEDSHVDLAIYNLAGQLVRRLVSSEMPAGRHSVVWNAIDDEGVRVASGIYVYVLRAGDHVAQHKLVLVK